jgi:ribosomal protein S27AE
MILEDAEGRVSTVGDTCSVCGRQTERMKRKAFHSMLSTFMGRKLTRRRCGECHWTDLSVKH